MKLTKMCLYCCEPEHFDEYVNFRTKSGVLRRSREVMRFRDGNLSHVTHDAEHVKILKLLNMQVTNADLNKYKNVTVLYLFSCKIDGPLHLEELVHIYDLTIVGMGISDVNTQVRFPSSVRMLELSHNAISDISNVSWPPKLGMLCLSNNHIKDIHVWHPGVKEVSIMCLSCNIIDDVRPLRSLHLLQKLMLDNNNISVLNLCGFESNWIEITAAGNPIEDLKMDSQCDGYWWIDLGSDTECDFVLKYCDICNLDGLDIRMGEGNMTDDGRFVCELLRDKSMTFEERKHMLWKIEVLSLFMRRPMPLPIDLCRFIFRGDGFL